MRTMFFLIKKELKEYFITPIAYIVLCIFLVSTSIIFVSNLFIDGNANLRNFFELLPKAFLILIPAITMRSWAEERQKGTIELLLTQPIQKFYLIVAKFLSSLFFVLISISFTLPNVVLVNLLGKPDNGIILANYIAVIFLAASYISICQFVSINSTSQIVAFVLSFFVLLILFLIGERSFLQFLPSKISSFLFDFGLGNHFYNIAKGIIDSRDLLYYLSLICFFNFFSFKSLKKILVNGF